MFLFPHVCLQKYLQQLWDTVLLVALILSTGVIVQARWQYQDHQLNDNLEVEGSIHKRILTFQYTILEDKQGLKLRPRSHMAKMDIF